MPASRNDKCVRQGRAAIVSDAHSPGCPAARSPKYSGKTNRHGIVAQTPPGSESDPVVETSRPVLCVSYVFLIPVEGKEIALAEPPDEGVFVRTSENIIIKNATNKPYEAIAPRDRSGGLIANGGLDGYFFWFRCPIGSNISIRWQEFQGGDIGRGYGRQFAPMIKGGAYFADNSGRSTLVFKGKLDIKGCNDDAVLVSRIGKGISVEQGLANGLFIDDDKQIRPFYVGNMFSGGLGGISCIGGGPESAPQKISLRYEDDQLAEQRGNGQNANQPRPPIGIIFFLGVASFVFSHISGFFGGKRLNDQRKLFGAALVGCSFLFLGLSLVLLAFSRHSL
jgi:hypothetical protein